MEPSSTLRHRRHNPLTPYHPDTWLEQLKFFNFFGKYPNLYYSLVHGFDVGVPIILQTYVPPNNPFILKHPEVYNEIVENKFQKKRYIGPFSQPNSRPSLAPSNLHPFLWSLNQENQRNIMGSMTSPTPTHWARVLSHRLTWQLTHTISSVPGKPFQQCV